MSVQHGPRKAQPPRESGAAALRTLPAGVRMRLWTIEEQLLHRRWSLDNAADWVDSTFQFKVRECASRSATDIHLARRYQQWRLWFIYRNRRLP